MNPDIFTAAIRHGTDLLDRRQVETDTWHVLGGNPGSPTASMRVDHLVKVVVYGGPLVIALHQVRDVILLHIEELVELVDAAGGDWATVECFLQDLGEHPGHDVVLLKDGLAGVGTHRPSLRLGRQRPSQPDTRGRGSG